MACREAGTASAFPIYIAWGCSPEASANAARIASAANDRKGAAQCSPTGTWPIPAITTSECFVCIGPLISWQSCPGSGHRWRNRSPSVGQYKPGCLGAASRRSGNASVAVRTKASEPAPDPYDVTSILSTGFSHIEDGCQTDQSSAGIGVTNHR